MPGEASRGGVVGLERRGRAVSGRRAVLTGLATARPRRSGWAYPTAGYLLVYYAASEGGQPDEDAAGQLGARFTYRGKREFFFGTPQLVAAEVVVPDLENSLLVGTKVGG